MWSHLAIPAKYRRLPMKRQLKALVFVDAVAFSARMKADEVASVEAINHVTRTIRALVWNFDGKVERYFGDGVFATFDSVERAVRCALTIQTQAGNLDRPPGDGSPVRFRIGIHMGETFESGEQLLGHAVTVAARLEGVAEAGGVCVSGEVRAALDTAQDLTFEAMGNPELKNIGDEITIYRVRVSDDAPPPAPVVMNGHLADDPLERQAQPSVAVLPFEVAAMEQELFTVADGFDDEIIGYLTRFRSLDVTSRESSGKVGGTPIADDAIGRRLNSRYLARGRVQVSGKRMRVKVRLLDALHDKVIWAETYDRTFEDVFDVQEDIAQCAVSAMAVQIEARERALARARAPESLGAYALMLRGRHEIDQFNAAATGRALRFVDQATSLDPHYSRAHAVAARAHCLNWKYAWVDDRDNNIHQAQSRAQYAIDMDLNDPSGHVELGFVSLYLRDHDRSLAAYERALELNPSDADVIAEYGDTLTHGGRAHEGIAQYEHAMRLNPFGRENYLRDLACAYFFLEDYDTAIRFGKSMENPAIVRYVMAASHAQLGRAQEAGDWARRIRANEPDFDVDTWVSVVPDKNPRAREIYAEGLRRAGL